MIGWISMTREYQLTPSEARELAWSAHLTLAEAVMSERLNSIELGKPPPPFAMGEQSKGLRQMLMAQGVRMLMTEFPKLPRQLAGLSMGAAIAECIENRLIFVMPNPGLKAYVMLIKHGLKQPHAWPDKALAKMYASHWVVPSTDGDDRIKINLRTGVVTARRVRVTAPGP